MRDQVTAFNKKIEREAMRLSKLHIFGAQPHNLYNILVVIWPDPLVSVVDSCAYWKFSLHTKVHNTPVSTLKAWISTDMSQVGVAFFSPL